MVTSHVISLDLPRKPEALTFSDVLNYMYPLKGEEAMINGKLIGNMLLCVGLPWPRELGLVFSGIVRRL